MHIVEMIIYLPSFVKKCVNWNEIVVFSSIEENFADYNCGKLKCVCYYKFHSHFTE